LKSRFLWLSLMIGMGIFLIGSISAFPKVMVNVNTDAYVLPVAELASTKTNPEIIHLENDLIGIEIIPNRGRVLSSYTLKTGHQSFLYQKFVPDPMVLPGGLHTVEFGGYYLSLPWNTRDRQPFDLAFEINQSTESLGEVYLSGKDMFQKTLTEIWLRLKDRSPVVEIQIKITNTSKKSSKEIDFRDYSILAVNDTVDSNDQILLPVEKVKLIESKNDWAGTKDSLTEWPAPFSQWTSLNDYLVFRSESQLISWFGGIYYPEIKAAFIKFWAPQDFFTGAEIWSWGKNYSSEPGAAPYVVYSNTAHFTLLPQESKSFITYFTALTDLNENDLTYETINQRIQSIMKMQ